MSESSDLTRLEMGGGEGLLPSLRAAAEAAGVTEVGVCSAEPFPEVKAQIDARVAQGLSGPLKFTYSNAATATDVRQTFAWAESLVVLGLPYLSESAEGSGKGEVARFATQDHYEALQGALSAVVELLQTAGYKAQAVFDDNSLVDRAVAQRAGIGWWGRNTMVIAPGVGPWLLLGTVVTDAPIEASTPMERTCGTCFACTPACPTGALDTPGVLDARKCLATWLQSPLPAPFHLRTAMGSRVYGCDDCLTACPPGSRYLHGVFDPGGYQPDTAGLSRLDLQENLELSDNELLERFPHFYIPKRRGKYLRRNMLVALANTASEDSILLSYLDDPSSVIRSTAAWGVGRIGAPAASAALRTRLGVEGVSEVRDELHLALLSCEHEAAYEELMRIAQAVSVHGQVDFLALIGSHAVGEGHKGSDLDLQLGVLGGMVVVASEFGGPDSATCRSVDDAQIWSWVTDTGLEVEVAVVPSKQFDRLTPVQTAILERGVVKIQDRSGNLAQLRRKIKSV